MKFVNTLRTMSWGWFFRYYAKRARIYWHLFCSRLVGRTYWVVCVGNTEVKLFWHTPYHHDYARNLALGRHEPTLLKKWEAESKRARTIVDAGAYNGIYGLLAA